MDQPLQCSGCIVSVDVMQLFLRRDISMALAGHGARTKDSIRLKTVLFSNAFLRKRNCSLISLGCEARQAQSIAKIAIA
jgi:hypothetical protein